MPKLKERQVKDITYNGRTISFCDKSEKYFFRLDDHYPRLEAPTPAILFDMIECQAMGIRLIVEALGNERLCPRQVALAVNSDIESVSDALQHLTKEGGVSMCSHGKYFIMPATKIY
jgi:hypothetical protein